VISPERFALRVIVWAVLVGLTITLMVVGDYWICFVFAFGLGLGRLWERWNAKAPATTIIQPTPFTGPDDPRQWKQQP
jgi:hypothetical protein